MQCKKVFKSDNKINSITRQIIWFEKWVIGKRTLNELSKESGKSSKTLQRLFKNYLNNPPRFKAKVNTDCHLLIDGTYFKTNFCALHYFDNDLDQFYNFRIIERENYYNYLTDLEFLKQLGLTVVSITSDGQKGLIKAVKAVYPNIIHQRCVIHI
ncbi:transposase [Candidatus Parcubacteria bacterium]|nr:transposase [Candidatus Parcubacteria bacterium]